MSKIEEALRMAQAARRGALVPSSEPRESASDVEDQGRSMAVISGRRDVGRHVDGRDIGKMRDIKAVSSQDLARIGIIHGATEENGVVKALRELRTKIVQRANGRNCCVMVTGVSAGSGSSFVAANLAVTFAMDSSKTALLMDCNLHHPSLQRLVPSQEALGLTDYFENPEIDPGEIIHAVGIPRLRVVPLGKSGSGAREFVSSTRMRQLLNSMVHRYPDRFIVIDASPMTKSADAQILAELCDLAVVVTAYGKATESELMGAVKVIDRQKFLGVVINDEPALPPLDWRQILRTVFPVEIGARRGRAYKDRDAGG